MSINGPEDIGFSKTTFFSGSLAIFGSGLLYGVYKVTKREKFPISLKSQKPEIMMAARALMWGTALCFGAFATAGAAFCYTTKVTNVKEFDVWARQVGLSVPLPKLPDTPETRAESKEIEDDLNRFVESIVSGVSMDEPKTESGAEGESGTK